MFGDIVDAASSVAVPVASGLLRRTPAGMAVSAGIAAVGSGIKYGKDGDLSWGDLGNIALDTAGNVAGSALGPLAFKGLTNSALKGLPNPKVPLSVMNKSNHKLIAGKHRLKEGANRLFYSDQIAKQKGLNKGADNVTKLGKGYAGVGSFLGYRPDDLTALPGMGGAKQIPTRAAGPRGAA